MKKYCTYFLFVIFLCTFCTFKAGAQIGKNLSKIGRTPKITSVAQTQALTQIEKQTKNVQAASRAAQVTQKIPGLTPALPSTRMARFVTEHRRELVGIQKTLGLSTRTSWENLKKLGAVHIPPAPRPQLDTKASFSAQNLADLALSREEREAARPHPFQNQRGLIYRGLALKTDAAFRNILENGLLIKDAGRESNNLVLSLSGGRAPSTAALRKITNLTDNATSAVMWAGKRMGRNDINTVVVVKSSETGSIITRGVDIPAEDIYAVTALLRVNGQPAWCQVEMEGEGFRITPYLEQAPAAE